MLQKKVGYSYSVSLAVFFCFGFLISNTVHAYTKVAVYPEDQSTVLPLLVASSSVEHFGYLEGNPHTYTFTIDIKEPYVVTLSTPTLHRQKSDVSMILVKQEKKGGVVEIGRTFSKDQTWEEVFNVPLGMSFKNAGSLAGELEPGTYILEVSSPSNDARYRLVWGEYNPSVLYFDIVHRLFEVLAVYQLWFVRALFSPFIYVPVGILLLFGLFLFWRKKQYR